MAYQLACWKEDGGRRRGVSVSRARPRGSFAPTGAGFPGNPVYHHVNTFMGSKYTGIDRDWRRRSAAPRLQTRSPSAAAPNACFHKDDEHSAASSFFHRRLNADLSSEAAFRADKWGKTSKLSRLKPVSLT